MTRDVRREETSKFESNYNYNICFVGIESKFIVCHPSIYIYY